MQNVHFKHITPVLSKYCDFDALDDVQKDREVCISPHPFKMDVCLLKISLSKPNGQKIEEQHSEISREKADLIEDEMSRICSNTIRFMREYVI